MPHWAAPLGGPFLPIATAKDEYARLYASSTASGLTLTTSSQVIESFNVPDLESDDQVRIMCGGRLGLDEYYSYAAIINLVTFFRLKRGVTTIATWYNMPELYLQRTDYDYYEARLNQAITFSYTDTGQTGDKTYSFEGWVSSLYYQRWISSRFIMAFVDKQDN